MAKIHLLSSDTINKIAAGEVVERPLNVVKELTENAIDAGASAITIDIKNGGIDMIRVTDNGCGIEADQVVNAFRRHATSKIEDAKDLESLTSLGFRGEALSSIAAISEVELITKTRDAIVGTRATNLSLSLADPQTADVIPLEISEAGAPDGTSVIVRNLFYNVPVRRKFLKSAQTEGAYITDLVEKLALSHPDISFHYTMNRQEKLHTTGNGREKEVLFRIYGRQMADAVIPIGASDGDFTLTGFLGRPEHARSSRSQEIFFVNNRILRSEVLSKALEEGYGTDLMQHRFPFAILHLGVPADLEDVNVHPSKMEVRFSDPRLVYDFVKDAVDRTLHKVELIPRSGFETQEEEAKRQRQEESRRQEALKNAPHTEQFEQQRLKEEGVSLPPLRTPVKKEDPNVLHEDFRKTPTDFAPFIHEVKKTAQEGAEPHTEQAAEEGKKAPASESTAFAPFAAPAFAPSSDTPGKETQDFLFIDRTNDEKKDRTEETPAVKEPEDGIAKEKKPSGTFEQASLFPNKDEPVEKTEEEKNAEALIADAARQAGDSAYAGSLQEHLFTMENRKNVRIVGCVFKTYWILEIGDRMLLMDQHAAHEKVNFEHLMKRLVSKQGQQQDSQLLSPPLVVNLTGKEEAAYEQYRDVFARMGYEIENYGDNAYALRAVPLELYRNDPDTLLVEILDEILSEKMTGTPAAILYRIASMSCKAAVKGGQQISVSEAKVLVDELLSLDNPFHCPHGRPTMIEFSERDLEKKFKRIV